MVLDKLLDFYGINLIIFMLKIIIVFIELWLGLRWIIYMNI